MTDQCSVKVAVRVRPLVDNEIAKGCKDIVEVVPENEQIVVKSLDRAMAFTYNYVLGSNSPHDELYKRCVKPILNNLYEGFNVTIFAYGQTGSGKTFSMGTAFKGEGEKGVIPRAVEDIFNHAQDHFSIDFTFTVSFIELYQEILYDLLSEKARDQCSLELREDLNKEIYIPGLTEVPVYSVSDVFDALTRGSLGRATGATAMNSQSSRSHAIFTINITVRPKDNPQNHKTAKLHLVDLAGSERPKKTGAVGNTFKEGVNINKGLFVLGNVISCLGDDKQQHSHIPYRDSNLTRLLKDSLGGNSITLMIACVSPADYNFDETISTLRYADRARKIKNKPIVNQDPKAAEIAELKKTIQQLRLQIVGQGGPVICPAELELLKREICNLKTKIRDLTMQLSVVLAEKTGLHEKIIILQNANESLIKKIGILKQQYDITFHNISVGLENSDTQSLKDNLTKLQQLQEHFEEISTQQKKTEDEIRNHEETFTVIFSTPKNGAGDTLPEFHEKHESHNNKQIQFNTELQEISKQLAVKEHLAQQLAKNTEYMVDYAALTEHEEKICILQKEKDELLQQLKSVKSQEVSNKIASQRRKRVQELEAQIQELQKKVQEQSRLIKLKEKDEQRIKQLNNEILQMKQIKVRLIKNMKEESDRFRQWKLQSQRELAKVKQQDRKKETEIAKMKVMHEKQQNVFKRKVEEAVALNRRLKDALALRKQVQNTKISGNLERIGPWLKQEFAVFINLVEAETTLEGLLEDRATLQNQLEELRNNSQIAADAPEIKTLEDDIELRSVQIQDLQQKLLDFDEETKSKVRFENIQTMGEAKFALKNLFEQVADIQKEKIQVQIKLNELQDSYSEVNEKVKRHEKEIEGIRTENQDHISHLQNMYEEKITILLRQLRRVKDNDVDQDGELEKRCTIQEERMEQQEKKIEALEKQNSELAAKLKTIHDSAAQSTPVLQLKHRKKNVPQITIENDNRKKNVPQSTIENDTFIVSKNDYKVEEDFIEASDVSIDEDNEKLDPDWRKTPLGKRIIADRRRFTYVRSNNTITTEAGPSKRSSDGGCTCKTNCLKRCGCRKLTRSCNSGCKCMPTSCENRANTENENHDLQEDASTEMVETEENKGFKKPRVQELEERITGKRFKNRTRLLFQTDV